MSNYHDISRFDEIIELAKGQVVEPYTLNFNLPVKIATAHLSQPHFPDVVEIAKSFHQKDKPERLYLSHGQYYNGPDGIKYIIDELNNKSDGNRAVLSLINQADIVNSGDKPIPSFMTMQFSLENQKDLYVTTYFRALEVSTFLRINLEEFRLIFELILHKMFHLENVYLTIFSFRAYIDLRLNPFIRPDIEMMEGMELLKLIEKSPGEISALLRQMDVNSTYLENNSLKTIQNILVSPRLNVDIPPFFKAKYFSDTLNSCIDHSEELIELRKKTSHNERISRLNDEYLKCLRQLIGEIDKNL